MTLHFEVRPAAKCSKKDVITAIGIYSSTVDSGSRTDTNQIKSIDVCLDGSNYIHKFELSNYSKCNIVRKKILGYDF